MIDPYQRPHDHPSLAVGVAHVWRAAIDPAPADFAALSATLSADERARAARFHFDRDRNKYVAARGILRRLLARYTGNDAAGLLFRYGPRGKPELDGGGVAQAVQFNVSHRGGFALYAFVMAREVGVDVEFVREVSEARAIARNHFTPAEIRLLESAADERAAQERFFRLWTRKEAVIKAVGTGLSMPLDEFDVSSEQSDSAPDNSWRSIPVPARPETAWAVCDIPVVDGYRGALCIAGESVEIRFFSV
ncbi:MAG TPA: 4'-phosphopantetheinyl transferase superfamily protein [Pirellulales bacterium]|nr:4'-phosphopantetheinyl transferase superfamily protein [Pirellulales bacterium]